jgi:N-acetylglucosaminyldiphosphoundecaprenol N-acetyl-beta-D-mannosaminyltransferase
VFTPNVDHVVLAHEDARLREAYARASLSLADGMPLIWTSRLLGTPLPEKVSGSDFVGPLLERAAARGWRVYFFGGAPGAAETARDRMLERLPELRIVGVDAPRVDVDEPPERRAPVLERIRAAEADLVLVGLGAPKQEIWIDQVRTTLRPAVLLGVGASLDFLAGAIPRAPPWMSRSGLEWLYRLGREPRRMWRRYLVRDPKFLIVMAPAVRRRWRRPTS